MLPLMRQPGVGDRQPSGQPVTAADVVLVGDVSTVGIEAAWVGVAGSLVRVGEGGVDAGRCV